MAEPEKATIISYLITIGTPLLSLGFGGIVGYFSGKQAKIDEIRIKEAFPKAEEISSKFLSIHELYNYFHRYWDLNFQLNFSLNRITVEQAADSIDTNSHFSLFKDKVNEYENNIKFLKELINSSHIYLNQKTLMLIKDYLNISYYRISLDSLGNSNKTEKFLDNLLDKTNALKRKKLYDIIFNKLKRLTNI